MTKSTNSKNNNIKKTMKETMERRKSQICAVYKVKIDESHLSKKQFEQLKMLFVEGKWLINSVINYSKNKENNIKNYDTKTDEVLVKCKDGSFQKREFKFIGSQMKQSVVANIISSIKTLSTSKKKGNKIGKLKFKSECKSINLKQYKKKKYYGRSSK